MPHLVLVHIIGVGDNLQQAITHGALQPRLRAHVDFVRQRSNNRIGVTCGTANTNILGPYC